MDDVKRCYADFYGASDSQLAVVGDFDPEQIARLAQDLFGDWKSPRPYARIPLRIAEVAPVDDVINTPDKANAVLRAGMLLRVRDDNPDYPALLLGNYLLGGSSDSRLMRRIREKEGLSYSVGSFLSADSFFERGSFGLFAIYAPQNRARVEAALTEELRKALRKSKPERRACCNRDSSHARATGRSPAASLPTSCSAAPSRGKKSRSGGSPP